MSSSRNSDSVQSQGWLRGRIWIGLGTMMAVILGAAAFAGHSVWRDQKRVTRWTMINVCPGNAQADSHLLEFPDGAKVLIDAGEAADAPPETLVRSLHRREIDHLALVIISHFHKDHYGQLINLIKSGIKVDRVAVNVPADQPTLRHERAWGYDPEDVQALLQFLADQHIPYFTPKAGDRLLEIKVSPRRVVALDVVCLYDGLHTPVGETDANDTSIILRLSDGANRALFAGDLNWKLGTWLAQSDFDLSADILKAPHHGTADCAPDQFFDRVRPSIVLVPAPKSLWLSMRSKRIRTYFDEHHVPAYVSGIDGDVTVVFTGKNCSVQAKPRLEASLKSPLPPVI